MRRVKAFFQWQAEWWMDKVNNVTCVDPAVAQGMVAYAHRQSRIRLDMLAVCNTAWRNLDAYAALGVGQPVGDVFLIECH